MAAEKGAYRHPPAARRLHFLNQQEIPAGGHQESIAVGAAYGAGGDRFSQPRRGLQNVTDGRRMLDNRRFEQMQPFSSG